MTPPAPAIDVDALLRRLHLPTVRRLYPDFAERAEQDSLGYRDFLALLMAEEVAHRAQTRIQRCVRRAHFPFLKTIDEYDFTLQAGVRLALLGSALSPEFVTQGQTLILSGPSGTGKTHLAVAIAYRAIQNGFEARFTSATALIDELSTATVTGRLGQILPGYTHPHVLVIDEVGYLSYGPDAANVLFQVVNDRYLHHRPMIFTTNKPLGAWGRVLHDPDLAEAILDRVLERGRHLELRGPSYRTRHVKLDLHHDLRAPSGRPTRISGNQVSEFPEPTGMTHQGWDLQLLDYRLPPRATQRSVASRAPSLRALGPLSQHMQQQRGRNSGRRSWLRSLTSRSASRNSNPSCTAAAPMISGSLLSVRG
jgi:DNA replication protein DnaC